MCMAVPGMNQAGTAHISWALRLHQADLPDPKRQPTRNAGCALPGSCPVLGAKLARLPDVLNWPNMVCKIVVITE